MARTSYTIRIKTRISELEQQIAAAQSELEELRVAERVLGRFTTDPDDEYANSFQKVQSEKTGTISDQIIQVLTDNGPLETPSVVEAVNKLRSDPASAATIQSTLSRVRGLNKIGHDGSRWYAVKSDSAQQASQTNEAPEGASKISVWD